MLGLGEGVVGVVVEGVFVDVDAECSLAVGVAEGLGDGDEFGGALEGVVRADEEGGVGDDGFHGRVGVDSPLLAGGEVVVARSGWFVDHFDADDDVGVFLGAVFLGHGDEDGGGLVKVVVLLPVHGTLVAGVLLAVLGAGATVTIYQDLHTCRSGPADCLV